MQARASRVQKFENLELRKCSFDDCPSTRKTQVTKSAQAHIQEKLSSRATIKFIGTELIVKS